MSYTIRAYNAVTDKDSVIAIMLDVWGKLTVSRFLAHYKWNQDFHQNVESYGTQDVVIEKDGEIVGYTRLMGSLCKVGEHNVPSVHLSDAVVHKQHRGSGIKLLRHLLSADERVLLGVPTQRTIPLWEKLAKTDVRIGLIKRYVLVLRPSAFLLKKKVPLVLGSIVDCLWSLVLRYLGKDKALELDLSSSSAAPAKEEYEALKVEFSKQFYGIVVRDYAYFCWRFFSSQANYKKLWVRKKGKLVGYCIYREAEVESRKVLLLIDIVAIGNAIDVYQKMLRLLVQTGLRGGYADIQTIATGCEALSAALTGLRAVAKVDGNALVGYTPIKGVSLGINENERWNVSLADGDYEFVMYPYLESKSV